VNNDRDPNNTDIYIF